MYPEAHGELVGGGTGMLLAAEDGKRYKRQRLEEI